MRFLGKGTREIWKKAMYRPDAPSYLGSPVNMKAKAAYERMLRDLEAKLTSNDDIFLQTLQLNCGKHPRACYVDLGFHDEYVKFAEELDAIHGGKQRPMVPESVNPSSYSGGRTRIFAFVARDGSPYEVVATFYRPTRYEDINIYLKAHEEAHVAIFLGQRQRLVDRVDRAFHDLSPKSFADSSDDLLATAAGFIPFADAPLYCHSMAQHLSEWSTTAAERQDTRACARYFIDAPQHRTTNTA